MLKQQKPIRLSKRYRQISKNSPNTKEANTTLEHLLAINHEIEKLKKLQLIL